MAPQIIKHHDSSVNHTSLEMNREKCKSGACAPCWNFVDFLFHNKFFTTYSSFLCKSSTVHVHSLCNQPHEYVQLLFASDSISSYLSFVFIDLSHVTSCVLLSLFREINAGPAWQYFQRISCNPGIAFQLINNYQYVRYHTISLNFIDLWIEGERISFINWKCISYLNMFLNSLQNWKILPMSRLLVAYSVGALGHGPLWPEKNRKTWFGLLCESISGQRESLFDLFVYWFIFILILQQNKRSKIQ